MKKLLALTIIGAMGIGSVLADTPIVDDTLVDEPEAVEVENSENKEVIGQEVLESLLNILRENESIVIEKKGDKVILRRKEENKKWFDLNNLVENKFASAVGVLTFFVAASQIHRICSLANDGFMGNLSAVLATSIASVSLSYIAAKLGSELLRKLDEKGKEIERIDSVKIDSVEVDDDAVDGEAVAVSEEVVTRGIVEEVVVAERDDLVVE